MTNFQLLENISQKGSFLDASLGNVELTKPLKSTVDDLIKYLHLDKSINWETRRGESQELFYIYLRGKSDISHKRESFQISFGGGLIITIENVQQDPLKPKKLAGRISDFLWMDSSHE